MTSEVSSQSTQTIIYIYCWNHFVVTAGSCYIIFNCAESQSGSFTPIVLCLFYFKPLRESFFGELHIDDGSTSGKSNQQPMLLTTSPSHAAMAAQHTSEIPRRVFSCVLLQPQKVKFPKPSLMKLFICCRS